MKKRFALLTGVFGFKVQYLEMISINQMAPLLPDDPLQNVRVNPRLRRSLAVSNLRSIHDSGISAQALQALHEEFPGGIDIDPLLRDISGTNVYRSSVPDPRPISSLSDDADMFDDEQYVSLAGLHDFPVAIAPFVREVKNLKEKKLEQARGSAYGQFI